MSLTKPWIPLGEAMMEYHMGNSNSTIYIKSTIEADRAVNVGVFFRENDEFPRLEREAFRFCKGKILDAGAGAGPHALYLQKKGFDITAMDISEKSVEVMNERGVKKAFAANIFDYTDDTYDTVLMMMNGIGIAGDLPGLADLLEHCKKLLKPGGQLLFDSTNIAYVTDYDRSMGNVRMPTPEYYGTVYYQLEFKLQRGEIYPWLFVDRKTLKRIALQTGYDCKILKSKQHQYLASLKKI